MDVSLDLGRWGRTGQRGALRNPKQMIPAALSVAAFVIDVVTPHGMIDGFLYVLPVLSCILVPGTAAVVYTAPAVLALMVFGFAASPQGVPMSVAVTNLMVGIGTIGFAAVIVWHNARLTRNQAILLQRIRKLQLVTADTAESERMELSRWLHESIAQELAAIGWGIDRITRHAGDVCVTQNEAQALRAAVDGAQQTIRGKTKELRHPDRDSRALGVRIGEHVASFSARTEISVAVRGAGCLPAVPENRIDLCFSFVQEALTNVAKHSGATSATIDFQATKQLIRVVVTDDGRGISEADRTKSDGLGLFGLEERLLAIGGELIVSAGKPCGARVEAQMPAEPRVPAN